MLKQDGIVRQLLLDLVVEGPMGILNVLPVLQTEMLNVRKVPGSSAEGYSKELLALFEAGLVSMSSDDGHDDVSSPSAVSNLFERLLKVPSESAMPRKLRKRPDGSLYLSPDSPRFDCQVSYKLTKAGGEEWEKRAAPDWNRLITQDCDFESGQLACSDLDRLMAQMGWFQELSERQIQLGTLSVEMQMDYPILYWKRLPKIYLASFSVKPAEPRWPGGQNGEPKWFREWWLSTTHWYTKPWELETWPTAT